MDHDGRHPSQMKHRILDPTTNLRVPQSSGPSGRRAHARGDGAGLAAGRMRPGVVNLRGRAWPEPTTGPGVIGDEASYSFAWRQAPLR